LKLTCAAGIGKKKTKSRRELEAINESTCGPEAIKEAGNYTNPEYQKTFMSFKYLVDNDENNSPP
jgi:hypothetical protein